MDLPYELKRSVRRKAEQAGTRRKNGDLLAASRLYSDCARLAEEVARLEPESGPAWKSRSRAYQDMALEVSCQDRLPDPKKSTSNAQDSAILPGDLMKATSSVSKVSFQDLAGLTAAKERIKETIIYPLTRPDAFAHYSIPTGGGLLMFGPPGCGKTKIAQAAAAESGLAFFEVGPSDVKDKYVGESEKNVRAIFEAASGRDGSIIFIDELDAMAPRRQGGNPGYETSLVSEFLIQMQRFTEENEHSLVIGATNRPWEVDIALRRPGRFDTLVFIPHPDKEARIQILKKVNQGRPLDTAVDFMSLSDRMNGFSGSEISEVCHKAARCAFRECIDSGQMRPISKNDFDEVLTGFKSGTPSWYRNAVDELTLGTDKDLFADMVDAGVELLNEIKPA
jgi:transitional endoplasmic reticulum ATPase